MVKKSDMQVYADRERISQVIINLLTNAIKYSPPKTRIIVEIKLSKRQAIVSVRDYGAGIGSVHQKKIFGRYYRADELDITSIPGFSLGLYISQEIIKQNDGKLWLESKADKGSKFYFSLRVG